MLRALIPWPLVVLAAGVAFTAAGEIEYRSARETMFSDVVRNQIQTQRLRELRTECDRLARRDGYYPRSAAEFNRGYRRKAPRGPWGGTLKGVIDAAPEAIAAAERTGVDYKIIGNGLFDPELSSSRAYGAILYRGDGRSFALYGVGKVRDWAVVVATEYGALD